MRYSNDPSGFKRSLAAARAENQRLREALEEIADIETPQAQVLLIARAALTSGGRG